MAMRPAHARARYILSVLYACGRVVSICSLRVFAGIRTHWRRSFRNIGFGRVFADDPHMPDVQLPLAEGVRMNYWLSFPSGHTTSFFALALVVCMIYTRETRETRETRKTSTTSGIIQTLLFYLAALGGYSRIYLSQHFPKDVFAGMIIGIGITLLCYVVFYRFKDQKWFNFRLFQKK